MGLVSGKITNESGNTPLRAQIRLTPLAKDNLPTRTVDTNERGEWSANLPPSSYGIAITADGYSGTNFYGVTVKAGSTWRRDSFLKQRNTNVPATSQPAASQTTVQAPAASANMGMVSGKVTDKSGNTPLRAQIRLTPSSKDGLPTRTINTNERGEWAINNLAPSLYSIAITADGYKGQTFHSVTVKTGTTWRRDVFFFFFQGRLKTAIAGKGAGAPKSQKAKYL
jgi:hypothetical protein